MWTALSGAWWHRRHVGEVGTDDVRGGVEGAVGEDEGAARVGVGDGGRAKGGNGGVVGYRKGEGGGKGGVLGRSMGDGGIPELATRRRCLRRKQ